MKEFLTRKFTDNVDRVSAMWPMILLLAGSIYYDNVLLFAFVLAILIVDIIVCVFTVKLGLIIDEFKDGLK